jgi:excisionase family DNA binding protein
MISGPDPILVASEVAADLHCSKAHVYNLIRGAVKGAPRLRAIKMGRRVVVRRSSLEQWKSSAEEAFSDATLSASPEVDAVGASRRNR